ncbi:MAG: phosphotransferase [Angustibacter sp.]
MDAGRARPAAPPGRRRVHRLAARAGRRRRRSRGARVRARRGGDAVVVAPLAPWFRTEEACWAVGRWVRDFQRAQAGLRLDLAKPWRRVPGAPLGEGQVLVHHDVSPYNAVRRPDGSLVVLDWDFARPGDPVEDLAWAAWRWVPLMAGSWWHTEYGIEDEREVEPRRRRNLAALLDGYGPSAQQRLVLADAVATQMRSHAADLEELARTDPAFARLVERDYARLARADAEWWLSSGHRLVPRA